MTHIRGMNDIDTNLAILENAGYRSVGYFVLPESVWWDNYYGFIEQKLAMLRIKYHDNPQALTFLAARNKRKSTCFVDMQRITIMCST